MLDALLVSLNPIYPMPEYKSLVGYGSHSPVQVAWKELNVSLVAPQEFANPWMQEKNANGSVFCGKKR
jgi:hypothetical protein